MHVYVRTSAPFLCYIYTYTHTHIHIYSSRTVLDLSILLPFYIQLSISHNNTQIFLRIFKILRIFRIFSITQRFKRFDNIATILILTIYNSYMALFALIFCSIIFMVFFGSLVYLLEQGVYEVWGIAYVCVYMCVYIYYVNICVCTNICIILVVYMRYSILYKYVYVSYNTRLCSVYNISHTYTHTRRWAPPTLMAPTWPVP